MVFKKGPLQNSLRSPHNEARQRYLKGSVEFWITNREKDDLREDAKDAKYK